MEDIDEKLYGFGIPPLKMEGGKINYPGPRLPPPTRWWRLKERLSALPGRIWWAFFGGKYY